jgi:hypothetical protein
LTNSVQPYCRFAMQIIARMPRTSWTQRFLSPLPGVIAIEAVIESPPMEKNFLPRCGYARHGAASS